MGIACVSETLTMSSFFLFSFYKNWSVILYPFLFSLSYMTNLILKKKVVLAVCGLKSEQPLKNSNKVKL